MDNSVIFNGEGSLFTAKAREIYELAQSMIKEKEYQLRELEDRMGRNEQHDDQHSIVSNLDNEDDFTRDSTMMPVEDTIYPLAEDDESNDAWSNVNLNSSKMQQEGQLNADLELSDTDSEDEEGTAAKRMRVDDDLDTF